MYFLVSCSHQVFQVPQLECALASVEGQSISGDGEKPSQLAAFLRGTLHLAASTLNQLHVKVSRQYRMHTVGHTGLLNIELSEVHFIS